MPVLAFQKAECYPPEFMGMYPQYLASPNLWEWLTPNNGPRWTRCHFWSNFEVRGFH